MPDFMRATEVTPDVEAAIVDAFQYHPWDADKIAKGEKIRAAGVEFVKAIVANVPPCPTRTVAIRKVMEARMDSNSAITHNGAF